MKKEESNVSRRKFLAAGTAAIGSSVLLAGSEVHAEETTAENLLAAANSTTSIVDDVVTTTATQTLTNKTISAESNNLIIGTEYLNLRQMSGFPTGSNTDITTALNNAITRLNTYGTRGGQILVPRGQWTSSGGHNIGDSTSIEGVHVNSSTGIGEESGTQIRMTGSGGYMFRIGGATTDSLNCSIKNLNIRMDDNPTATGLLMSTASGHRIYGTYLENVHFWGGDYGIRVATGAALQTNYRGVYKSNISYDVNDVVNIGAVYYKALLASINKNPTTNPTYWQQTALMGEFECIMNVFNRVQFVGCRVAFYCETNNSGFEFNTPYVYLQPNSDSVGFYCYLVGTLTVNNHLCVTNSNAPANGATILYTVGGYNNIAFQNGGQDEQIQYLYRNSTNHYSFSPIVFRNCLIQSEIKVTANTSFVSDSNHFVNFQGSPNFKDSSSAWCKIYLMGKNGVETRDQYQAILYGQEVLAQFVNSNSAIINPYNAPLGWGL